eukprot:353125-Chlamydomonas_euryale.AAC.13
MRSASSFFVGAKKGKKEEERPNQGLRVARSQEEDYSLYRFEPLLRWGALRPTTLRHRGATRRWGDGDSFCKRKRFQAPRAAGWVVKRMGLRFWCRAVYLHSLVSYASFRRECQPRDEKNANTIHNS